MAGRNEEDRLAVLAADRVQVFLPGIARVLPVGKEDRALRRMELQARAGRKERTSPASASFDRQTGAGVVPGRHRSQAGGAFRRGGRV